MKKEDVLAFVKSQQLAVVATVQDDKPQAAVVEFGELDDLTIIIDTLKSSRKYKNLQANQNTAVVIGWDNDITVQIDGTAKEVTDQKELKQIQAAYFAKNPKAEKWSLHTDIVFFSIKPIWLRYSDLSTNPWQVQEFTF